MGKAQHISISGSSPPTPPSPAFLDQEEEDGGEINEEHNRSSYDISLLATATHRLTAQVRFPMMGGVSCLPQITLDCINVCLSSRVQEESRGKKGGILI